MEKAEIIKRLEAKGIKATANRIQIYKEMADANRSLSLGDLESLLKTIDKSNIFRTLTLFRQHHLLHVIEDGSDSVKYEICHSHGECDFEDLHVHFYCEQCHTTYCLEDIHIPMVVLPEHFQMNSINYVVKGICPKCKSKPLMA